MRAALLLLPMLALAGCASPADDAPTAGSSEATARSPYAGEEARWIKALSPQEIDDLRHGRGMGYAKAAELNSYPGPLHVLDLAGELGLTDDQRARMQALFDAMRAEAVPLGERIIAAEAALERAFATGDVDGARIDEQVAHVAALDGKLRAAHLRAHVDAKAILTPQQIERYDALRGYGAGGAQHAHDTSHG